MTARSLDHKELEDTLRMLTALSAILKAEPELPSAQFAVLEPAIGDDMIRYDNQQGCYHLAWRADELRRRLAELLGERLTDKELKPSD